MLSSYRRVRSFSFFFFNDTATTEIYTLSLHDALPICCFESLPLELWLRCQNIRSSWNGSLTRITSQSLRKGSPGERSEEHTSELQSQSNLVCRLLLEKKKKKS